jgi:two-component system response regulator AtoC
MIEVHKQIGVASRGRANVLITGESGTGKELVARSIHRHSTPDQPFIPVNCSALVPTLLESELFGHVKGAFTGADRDKPGRLELAGNGSLFLDEIGDLDASLQVKLLRVLQERTYQRVGGEKELPFRARVIAATHRNLDEMLSSGTFREDLYYRLKVAHIHLPPLRERKEDLPVLVEHLLVKANRTLHREVNKVPDEVMEQIHKHDWPGNVRELENRIQVAVLTASGDVLHPILPSGTQPSASETKASAQRITGGWQRSLEDVEREHITRVLEGVGGNYGEACEILGISRPTLRKKLRDYGLMD